MRAVLSLALILAACGGGAETANEAAAGNSAAATDIDVLPADESVGTDSSALASGVNDPELNEADGEATDTNAVANEY